MGFWDDDDWDGSLDDDLGRDPQTGRADGGGGGGGGDSYSDRNTVTLKDMLETESFDEEAVDVYTGDPDTNVWDESNMDKIPDPMDPGTFKKSGILSKLLQLIGVGTMNPALYKSGAAIGAFGKAANIADQLFGENTIRPDRVPGTEQYTERHSGDSLGGVVADGGGGSSGSASAGAGASAGAASKAQLTPEELTAILAASMKRQPPPQNPFVQGLAGIGIGKLPSGAEQRRRRTTLFR